MISDKLKGKDDLKLKVNNPEKLERILRSAINKAKDEFGWIGEKFIISVSNDSISFSSRQFAIEEIEEPGEVFEDADFFFIMNILLLQKKDRIEFIRPVLENDEINRIKNWATANNYSIYNDGPVLRITKNA